MALTIRAEEPVQLEIGLSVPPIKCTTAIKCRDYDAVVRGMEDCAKGIPFNACPYKRSSFRQTKGDLWERGWTLQFAVACLPPLDGKPDMEYAYRAQRALYEQRRNK